MTEFELIKHYFAQQKLKRADVKIGIGDDCAIVDVPANHQLAVTTDTLVAGIHFPIDTRAADIGYKSLAVNLSDLAAMGATPTWVTLAITLPEANETWINDFCSGFFELANAANTQLIGGDVTRGPLSITVQALGLIKTDQCVTRAGAHCGDLIYVTGTLGDAGAGLQLIQGQRTTTPECAEFLIERLNRPTPRVDIGKILPLFASAAIDISDGLAADLSHILHASQVGARINLEALPISKALRESANSTEILSLALSAGDDYELCFTIPPNMRTLAEQKLSTLACPFTCIGTITAKQGLDLHNADGSKYHGTIFGYQHF